MGEATSSQDGEERVRTTNGLKQGRAKRHPKYRTLEKSHNTSNQSPPEAPIQKARSGRELQYKTETRAF